MQRCIMDTSSWVVMLHAVTCFGFLKFSTFELPHYEYAPVDVIGLHCLCTKHLA